MKSLIAWCVVAAGLLGAAQVSAQQFNLLDVAAVPATAKSEPMVAVFKKDANGVTCGIRGQIPKSKLVPRWSSAVFIGLWKECGLVGFAFGGVDLWFLIDDVQMREADQWRNYLTATGPQLTCERKEQVARAGDVATNSAVARGFCN